MQLEQEIGAKYLEAYGDSKLIINQVHDEYEVWHEDLVPYHNATINMAEKFKSFYINHVPCQQNAHANALEPLATSLTLLAGATKKILIYNRDLYSPKFTLEENQNPERGLQGKVLETLIGPELRD